MINWVIGGVIFGLTIYIAVRSVLKMRKGKSVCCSGCSSSEDSGNCQCHHKP